MWDNLNKEPILSENKASKGIKVIDNTIYFYSMVTDLTIMELNSQLQQLDDKNKNLIKPNPIYLRINSMGGDVYASLAGLGVLRNLCSKVITVVDGVSASAATLLSIAGDERHIMKHSCMLLHQMSGGVWGKHGEIADYKINLDTIEKNIQAFYLERTKISKIKLKEIMKRDLFFDAKTCLKYGFVDKII